jgi:hypothetical protein
MIKIERISAEKPTLLRNGVRQPVTVSMTVTQAELESIESTSGSIVYSVDETEVKELVFQAKPAVLKPVIKPAAVKPIVPAAKTAKPVIKPTVAEKSAE